MVTTINEYSCIIAHRLSRNLSMPFVIASLVDFPLRKFTASLFISSYVPRVSASLFLLLTVPILSVTAFTNLGGRSFWHHFPAFILLSQFINLLYPLQYLYQKRIQNQHEKKLHCNHQTQFRQGCSFIKNIQCCYINLKHYINHNATNADP